MIDLDFSRITDDIQNMNNKMEEINKNIKHTAHSNKIVETLQHNYLNLQLDYQKLIIYLE